MRFVKIGHSWFNISRIERIRGDSQADGGRYIPIVKVYLQGKTFYFDCEDIGIEPRYYFKEEDAYTFSETMVEKVLQSCKLI